MRTSATGFLLLVCVIAALSGARSYWKRDAISFLRDTGTGYNCWALYSGPGSLVLIRSDEGAQGPDAAQRWQQIRSRVARSTGWHAVIDYTQVPHDLTFGFVRSVDSRGRFKHPEGFDIEEHIAWAVPWWLLVLLLGARPVWAAYLSIRGWRRTRYKQRQIELGFCSTCGYDMRATPDRCPECGDSADLPVGVSPHENLGDSSAATSSASPAQFPGDG